MTSSKMQNGIAAAVVPSWHNCHFRMRRMAVSSLCGSNYVIFLVFIGCIFGTVQGVQYQNGDKVPVYVNKVGPYANIHETYHYYQLPLCRPQKVIHKSLSLGQVLEGDRMAESDYKILFGSNVDRQSLCGSYSLENKEVDQLITAVEEQYYFEIIVDDIRVRNFLGYVDEKNTFPHTHRVFIYTHYIFYLEYNAEINEIITANLQSDLNSAVDLATIDSSKFELFYSVKWAKTPERMRQTDESKAFFNARTMHIQWMSVLNSALLVVLLLFFVGLILLSVVKRDLSRYNDESGDDDMLLENGWKTISMDVFRTPNHTSILASVLGVGSQFLFLVAMILLVGSTNIINVHHHGALNTVAVVMYAFTSVIAGFVSARVFRQLDGTNWIANVNLTTGLFAVPMFIVWALNNTVSWIYDSTQALPYTTVLVLGLLWLCVGYPLTVIGAAVGKNVSSKYSAPCRTRNVPRELPLLPFYHSTFFFSILGGFLPFSAISVELYYIFSTVWGRETYTLFYIMLIVLCLLVAVVAASSASLAYFQLNAEDYRWWWRSVFVGGSVGVFVFLYGIFFYIFRSDMSGLLQTTQYFSYLLLLCYVFFLTMGSVSFFASHRFIRFIYSSIKTD